MRVGKYFSLVLLSLAASTAGAKELLGPDAGVVPFGMGRAYSAIADDWLSLYYNPAGLAMVKGVDFQLFDIRVGTNNDVLGNYNTFKSLGKAGSISDTINTFHGQHLQLKTSNHTQITFPGVALGFVYDVNADIDIQNNANTQTNMRFVRDMGFLLGGGFGVGGKDKPLRMGATFKYIRRVGGERYIPFTMLAGNRTEITNQFNAAGWGFGADVGMQWKLPSKGGTEVITSFVWHDIGHTAFGTPQQQDTPTRIQQNITAGFALRFPIQGKQDRRRVRRYGPKRSSSHLSFVFDYSHANIPWHVEQMGKHLHAGINLDIPILSFQVGVNQSALSLGTSFDIGIARVSAATWGEELGSFAGQRVDRRYLLSVSSVISFGSF